MKVLFSLQEKFNDAVKACSENEALLISDTSLKKIKLKKYFPVKVIKKAGFLSTSTIFKAGQLGHKAKPAKEEVMETESLLEGLEPANTNPQSLDGKQSSSPTVSKKAKIIICLIVAVITLPLISYFAIEYFSAKSDVEKELDSQEEDYLLGSIFD